MGIRAAAVGRRGGGADRHRGRRPGDQPVRVGTGPRRARSSQATAGCIARCARRSRGPGPRRIAARQKARPVGVSGGPPRIPRRPRPLSTSLLRRRFRPLQFHFATTVNRLACGFSIGIPDARDNFSTSTGMTRRFGIMVNWVCFVKLLRIDHPVTVYIDVDVDRC